MGNVATIKITTAFVCFIAMRNAAGILIMLTLFKPT
jgi:hypothetical protein